MNCIKKERMSIHKWKRMYKIKILFMSPGQKNKKMTQEEFVKFIKSQNIQLTVGHYSLDEKMIKEVV